jgi:PAS domain S-box-containing protein
VLANRYGINIDDLREAAGAYLSRPPYIIGLAKDRLMTSARLVGEMVHRKQMEVALQQAHDELEQKVDERTLELQNEIEERKVIEEELRTTTEELLTNIKELRHAEQSLHEHAKRMEILNRIIRKANESEDLPSLATLLVDHTIDLMDFDAGALFLLNEAEGVIELQYARGYSPAYAEERARVSIDEPHTAVLYRDHKPLWTEDVELAPPEIVEREHITVMAGIPLVAGGRVIGNLGISSSRRYQFTEAEKDLLVAIGREAGTVIAKMQAEEELMHRGEMLDLANDAIMIIDLSDVITYWNLGAERLYGWTREEATGQNVHKFLQTEYPVSLDDTMNMLHRDGAWDGELIHTTRDNARIVVESHWTLYQDSEGRPLMIFEINSDITERKEADEKVRVASLYSRSLIEASLDPLVTISAEGTITDVNKATEDVTGLSREELIGSDFSNYFTEPERAREGYQKVFTDGLVWDYPLAIRHTSGRITDVLYNATVYRNDAGEIQGVFAAARDITEKKKSEEALIAERDRLETVTKNVAAGLAIVSRDYRTVWVNRVLKQAYGEVEGKLCYEAYNRRTEVCPGCGAKQIFETGIDKAVYEREGRDDHGNITWSQIIDTAIQDDEGNIIGVLKMTVPITDRKQAEEKVRAASLYSRSLLEASLDPLVTISAEGKITDVNKATEDVTGLSRGELIGSDFSNYFTDPADASAGYRKVFTDGFVRDYALAIRHKSGTITDVLYNATVYRNEAGEIQGVFAAARDVTERKRAEEALRRAHDELEKIVRERTRNLQEEIEERKMTEEELRSTAEELRGLTNELRESTEELRRSNEELEQFAYIASHDLQEPLRTVTSSLGLLESWYKGELGAEADTFISYAVSGTKQMQQLIKDLLAYSRVTSRGEAFKTVHCEGIVQHALDNLKTAIEESGVKIRLPETMPTVMGDKTQLIQLLQNLIGNAIKFRSERPAEVQIGVERGAGRNELLFSVRDNGIGMDMQYAAKVFTIFQRLHTTEEYPGTGVGLALCRKIVERHGGRIWVESTLGEGSTFYFTLPVSHTTA